LKAAYSRLLLLFPIRLEEVRNSDASNYACKFWFWSFEVRWRTKRENYYLHRRLCRRQCSAASRGITSTIPLKRSSAAKPRFYIGASLRDRDTWVPKVVHCPRRRIEISYLGKPMQGCSPLIAGRSCPNSVTLTFSKLLHTSF
jgi:hypothetical protein